MKNYYSDQLNASKLRQCYEVAPTRVKQFLEAEINFVLSKIKKTDTVLDLGCGYGRVTQRIAKKSRKVIGIDISKENVEFASKLPEGNKNIEYYVMDAIDLSFDDQSFHKTLCIQNGISAFKVNPEKLIEASIRVTKKGGIVLFSSYAEEFWDHRLEWFQIQAEHGLIGEIDYNLTRKGEIVCKDGFKATTFSRQTFLRLASLFNVQAKIHKVDKSSIFCEMVTE